MSTVKVAVTTLALSLASLVLVQPGTSAVAATNAAQPTAEGHVVVETIQRDKRKSCSKNGVTYFLRVWYLDYGNTVEPTSIRVSRGTGTGLDYTVKYRPGDNGGTWWSQSNTTNGGSRQWDNIDQVVSTHSEDVNPNVQAHLGPHNSTVECPIRVNLY